MLGVGGGRDNLGLPSRPVVEASLLLHTIETGHKHQRWVVQKPVSANPGLNVNRSIHFLCIKMFCIDYVLRSLRFFKLKPEGKKI